MLFSNPPDPKSREVYNEFNGNLANLFYCVKNLIWEFLRFLGFLPINSREEFIAIRNFIDMEEFHNDYLKQELQLARHNFSHPNFEALLWHYNRDNAFYYCDPPYCETKEYSLGGLLRKRIRAVLCKVYRKGT